MGQRHQIYAVLPYEFKQLKEHVWGDKKEEYVDSNTVALHHQWLYGSLPLRRLQQVLEFYEAGKEEKYHIFKEKGQYCSGSPEDALKALYSLDIASGGYHAVGIEPNTLAQNPGRGDNNDGITIIDFREEKHPKYAFLFFNEYDGERIAYQPLSAEQYIRTYYNEARYTERENTKEERNYWENEIQNLVPFFEEYPVLTQQETEALFPQLFVGIK